MKQKNLVKIILKNKYYFERILTPKKKKKKKNLQLTN